MKPLSFGLFENAQANDSGTATWRHDGNERVWFDDPDYWRRISRLCEDGGFDWLFLADAWGWAEIDGRRPDICSVESLDLPRLDPAIVAAMIARMTTRLGIVITGSTLLEAPYAFARRMATLDHLSGGRIGWNIVTTGAADTAARAFGVDMVGHDARYDMADDFMALAYKLFEGAWAPDALERDRAGRFADPAKVHRVEHDGPYFRCSGYGNASHSPQGTPLLFQAGASPRGLAFAGRHAECVFLGGGAAHEVAAQARAIRREARRHGRPEGSIRMFCAFSCVIGETAAAARAKHEAILAVQRPELAAASYAMFTGIDLTAVAPETPMSALTTELSRSQIERFGERTAGDVLAEWRVNGVRPAPVVGAPEEVADALCALAAAADLDGFVLTPIVQPASTVDFIETVMPLLRARGVLREQCGAATLRGRVFGAGATLPDDHPGAAYRPPAS